MENDTLTVQNKKNDLFFTIEGIFWIAFIVIPLFTGFLAYHWLPNESPILSSGEVIPPNEIISSHEECRDDNSCGIVADIWRDTKTNKVYTHDDFKEHRNSEKVRMALVWFCYGLIGCFFYAGVKYYKNKTFFEYFSRAVLITFVVALLASFSW